MPRLTDPEILAKFKHALGLWRFTGYITMSDANKLTKLNEASSGRGRVFPWRCPECGKKEVRPAVISHTSQIKHDGRLYNVEVAQLRVPRCGACGEIVFDNDADEQIARALRDKLGLLSWEQIRANRDALGLSQRRACRSLGSSGGNHFAVGDRPLDANQGDGPLPSCLLRRACRARRTRRMR